MAWTSKTKQFSQSEMNAMEEMSATNLRGAILASDPIVGLRLLMELKLNVAEAKLTTLLRHEPLKVHISKYLTDPHITDTDRRYAQQLGF